MGLGELQIGCLQNPAGNVARKLAASPAGNPSQHEWNPMKSSKKTLRNVLAGFILAAPMLGADPAGAAVLAQYNFNGTTPLAPSTVGSGISSASNIGFGGYAGAWTEPTGVLQVNPGSIPTPAAAVASGNYATFTLTSTGPMNLSSLTLDGAYSAFSSPAGYALESSADGYASILSTAGFTTQTPTFTTKSIDLSSAAFQGLSSITFRVFGYVNNTGSEQFDNITVNGFVGIPVSAANTTISASPASITADGSSTSTLTVQAKDASNNNFTSSGGTVTLSASAGAVGAVTDNGNGTYTATLTAATTAGTANITGTLGGATIGHPTSVAFTPGPVSAANSTISANPASITADGASTSTLTVQARDANNNNLASSGGTVTLGTSAGSLSGVTDNGDGTYTATLTAAAAPGMASITGTIAGTAIGHPATVILIGTVSAANTTISASPASISADGTSTSTLTVQARDVNGSSLNSSSGTVTLGTTAGSLGGVTDNGNGTYTATLTSSTTPGTASITGTIGGIAIGGTATVAFTEPVSAANTTISASPASIIADGTSTSTVTVQARDVNNNNLTSDSGTVTLSTTAGSLSAVTDNGDGTYTATLTSATMPGTANITGTIGGLAIGHPASVILTPRAGTLLFTKIEFVPTGTHVVWNAAPTQSYSVLASSSLAATFTNWNPTSVGVAGDFIDTNGHAGVPQRFYLVKENINPNPRISIHKPTAGYTAQAYQNTSGVDDGIFQTYATAWNAGWPTPAAPAWVAINLGQGPTRALLEWNAGGNYNYQETDYGGPGNYAIYTSSNSTSGSDGTWTQVASVTNNIYRTRAHSFDFTGMKWVKVVITAAPANSLNGAQFDEIEVYDISASYSRGRMAEDTWFFMGDSITAFWANRGTATGTNDPASHQPSFAAWINIDNTNYFPSMINGGIGGETSSGGLARLPQNLADNPDYHYWALCYGANDSAGNNSSTAGFQANMQAMINLLLANGRVPVIPHIAYTLDGQHNNIPLFNAVIDQLVATNHILAGPDSYTYFKNNTNDFQADGLHPNDAGDRAYNLIWSQAMRRLYP
jgi:lysophospholipase L1-like esterase